MWLPLTASALAFAAAPPITTYSMLKTVLESRDGPRERTLGASIAFPKESPISVVETIALDGAGHSLLGHDGPTTDWLLFQAEKTELTLRNLHIVHGSVSVPVNSTLRLYESRLSNISSLNSHGTLVIRHSTFTNTSGPGSSGIVNYGLANVSDSTFEGGAGFPAPWIPDGVGEWCGAVSNAGALNVERCTFRANRCVGSLGAGLGGAISNGLGGVGSANVRSSTFDDNVGGGGGAIYNGGTLLVVGSSFRRNLAASGGAILNAQQKFAEVRDSDFDSNAALPVDSGCGGAGGAVASFSDPQHYGSLTGLTLRGVRMTNNSAGMGGAVYVDGTVFNISGATFTRNAAAHCEGAEAAGGALHITHSTCGEQLSSLDFGSVRFDGNTNARDPRSADLWTDFKTDVYVLGCADEPCPFSGWSRKCAPTACLAAHADSRYGPKYENATCACSCACTPRRQNEKSGGLT